MPPERRVYGHVDMDAFYVSVELQSRPELAGLPVVVAGSGPRAVVTTASYEARKFGVFSATPAERARRLCPEAVFIPPDFEKYRARSREVMAVLREHVERVEIVGLDEAYLDLTPIERPKAAARRLKADVRERTGLTCSIGIGPNKLVAKVASDADKPDGFVVLSREQACERFAGASPGLIPGIGPKTRARLEERGVTTLAALAATPAENLGDWFGARLGPHLAALARFEDDRVIQTVRPPKSESRETTFDYDLRGLDALEPVLLRLTDQLCETLSAAARRGVAAREPVLLRLTDQLCETLVKQERRGRTIGIKVRLDDFSTHTRARSRPEATNDVDVVRAVALDLLREFDPPRPVRLIGVRVAGLDEDHAEPAAGQLELAL